MCVYECLCVCVCLCVCGCVCLCVCVCVCVCVCDCQSVYRFFQSRMQKLVGRLDLAQKSLHKQFPKYFHVHV